MGAGAGRRVSEYAWPGIVMTGTTSATQLESLKPCDGGMWNYPDSGPRRQGRERVGKPPGHELGHS